MEYIKRFGLENNHSNNLIKVSYSSKRIYFSLKKDTDHIKVLVFWGPWVRNDKNIETKQKLKVPTIINKIRYRYRGKSC